MVRRKLRVSSPKVDEMFKFDWWRDPDNRDAITSLFRILKMLILGSVALVVWIGWYVFDLDWEDFRPNLFVDSASNQTLNVENPDPETHSDPTLLDAKDFRSKAYQCKKEIESATAINDLVKAWESFRCAEDHYREGARENDSFSLWGLAILYGENVKLGRIYDDRDFRDLAVEHWCLARALGEELAEGAPLNDPSLSCD